MDNTVNLRIGIRRLSWQGTVIRACRKCQAPGVYLNDPSLDEKWPKCRDVTLMPGVRIPVGDTCPQCGARRPRDEDLGELSSSMPRWLWRLILLFKRGLIAIILSTRAIRRKTSWT